MLRRSFVLAVLLCLPLLASLPARADTNPAPSEGPPSAEGWFGYIDRRTLELPATHWRFELGFARDLAQRLVWDTAYWLTEPVRWDEPDWARFGGFAAATGAGFAADRTIDIESRIRHPRRDSERRVEDGFEELGDLGGVVGVVGGSALIGLATGNELAEQVSVDSGEALLISAMMTEGLKETTGRSRPNRGDGPFTFHPFSGNASFPSGHATAAFAMAAVLSEHFENRLWVAAPVYGLAAMVALARTRQNAHFASDVIVGGAIGAATGREIVTLEAERLGREQGASGGARMSVQPKVSPGFSGIELTLRY